MPDRAGGNSGGKLLVTSSLFPRIYAD
jgi:hypothetical protein